MQCVKLVPSRKQIACIVQNVYSKGKHACMWKTAFCLHCVDSRSIFSVFVLKKRLSSKKKMVYITKPNVSVSKPLQQPKENCSHTVPSTHEDMADGARAKTNQKTIIDPQTADTQPPFKILTSSVLLRRNILSPKTFGRRSFLLLKQMNNDCSRNLVQLEAEIVQRSGR